PNMPSNASSTMRASCCCRACPSGESSQRWTASKDWLERLWIMPGAYRIFRLPVSECLARISHRFAGISGSHLFAQRIFGSTSPGMDSLERSRSPSRAEYPSVFPSEENSLCGRRASEKPRIGEISGPRCETRACRGSSLPYDTGMIQIANSITRRLAACITVSLLALSLMWVSGPAAAESGPAISIAGAAASSNRPDPERQHQALWLELEGYRPLQPDAPDGSGD